MKKLLVVLLLFVCSINAQTFKLFWDLNGDKVADTEYTCSDGDTITAKLYLTNSTDTSIVSDPPIYAFTIPVLYGYYTRWSINEDYSNILTTYTAVFDTTAMIDSTGYFRFTDNQSLKRMLISYEDSASTAIQADSCIATITFIVSGTGNQLLHFNFIAAEDNNNMYYNTAVLSNKLINYDIWIRDCLIVSE